MVTCIAAAADGATANLVFGISERRDPYALSRRRSACAPAGRIHFHVMIPAILVPAISLWQPSVCP